MLFITSTFSTRQIERLSREKVKKTMGLCIKMQNPMMQLKKIVNHPYLVRWDVDPETGDYVVDEDMVTDSGKLAVLDQMLTRLLKDGHRVCAVFFCIKPV